jgi:hypothetical protein
MSKYNFCKVTLVMASPPENVFMLTINNLIKPIRGLI